VVGELVEGGPVAGGATEAGGVADADGVVTAELDGAGVERGGTGLALVAGGCGVGVELAVPPP
jgi:hypothetical protein